MKKQSRVFALVLTSICFALLMQSRHASANSFNWIKPYYSIAVGVAGGESFRLGRGVDMADPQNWILAPKTPFDPASLNILNAKPAAAAASVLAPGQVINFTYIENASEQEEAHYLYAYFRASYGLASFDAALTRARNERSTSRTVYLFATKEGDSESLVGGATWPSTLTSETIADPYERAKQFATEYGSHYISQITYGYSIIVRATVNSTSASELTSLTAHLKGSIGALSAGGTVSSSDQSYLQQASVNIVATIVSGGTTPARTLLLTSFDDLAKFLADFKSGAFMIKDAPVRATLTSWWASLASFPKTRAVFSDSSVSAPSPFGVPKGSVVAWMPTSEFIDNKDPDKITYPDGWRLCDGTLGVPNIGSAFLYGTLTIKDRGATGGASSHSHGVAVADASSTKAPKPGPPGGGSDYADPYHSHAVSVSGAENLPPYFKVLWICRQ